KLFFRAQSSIQDNRILESLAILLRWPTHATTRDPGVLLLNSRSYLRRGNAHGRHFGGIHPDTHTEGLSERVYVTHTGYTQHGVSHKNICIIGQKLFVVSTVRRNQSQYHQHVGIRLFSSNPEPSYRFRQRRFGNAYAVLYIERRNINIGAYFKGYSNGRTSVGSTGRSNVLHSRRTVNLALYRGGYGLFHRLRISAGITCRNRYGRRGNIGVLTDGETG